MNRLPTPPRLARRLLERALPADSREHISSDLAELFVERCARDGLTRARLWYWREAFSFSTQFLGERIRERSVATRATLRNDVAGAGVWLEFKLGLRLLVRTPALTLIGGLAIAVTIAISAAWFEFTNDYVNPGLPLPDSDRIVGIQNWDAVAATAERRTLHDFLTWQAQLRSVQDLGVFTGYDRNLITADARAEPVSVVEISASAFRVAATPPLLGRTLLEADEQAGAPDVAVIGYDVWRSRFGGDPDVLGRTIRLGASQTTVIGVMPEGFAFPIRQEIWLPFRADVSDHERREGPSLAVFGKLAPGATMASAQSELSTIGMRAAVDHSATNEHLRPRVMPYVESLLGVGRSVELGLMNGLFIMLLIVACVNVGTLVFARTATRESEIVVRSALGASRHRIVLQLFIEALVLASVAAALGLAATAFGLRWGMHLFWEVQGGQRFRPFWWDDGIEPYTVLYVIGLTLVAAALAGVLPALKMTGRHVHAQLREASAGGSGMRFGGVQTIVVVIQVALSVAVLPLAMFVGHGAFRQELGGLQVPAEQYLTARVAVDREGSFQQMQRELKLRLASESAVGGVTFASRLPGMEHERSWIEVEDGVAPPTSGPGHRASTASVDVDFFEAMLAPILAGRFFNESDAGSEHGVVIINQSFARRAFGDRNPIGGRVRVTSRTGEPGPWHEVVGLVPDLGMNPLEPIEADGMYLPMKSDAMSSAFMAVRLGEVDESFGPRLQSIVNATDPTVRLYDVMRLDQAGRAVQLGYRAMVGIVVLLAAIALLLSTAGVYALMSFTVARRTREIGIRAALGARPRSIVAAIFKRALLQLGIGVGIGCIIAGWNMRDELSGSGAWLLPAVAALMLAVGLFACGVPALRALRIPPTDALRSG